MVSSPRRWRPAWIWMAAVLLAGSAFAADDAIPLAPGTSVEGRLAAGEVEVYEASVAGDRRLVVAVEQRGIDVVVEARPSAGETLAADAPLYRQGPELLLLPPGAGSWRIALRSASPAVGPGAYRLTLDELSDADPARLAASSAMSAGGRHAHRGGAEALRLAAARYGEAVARWRQLGDRRLAGQALLAVAVLNRRLNEPRQALEGYREALELLRAAGDEAGEAVALNDLGFVHWQLGEHGRARSLLERAIERQRARGDRYGEAVARGNLCLVAHSEGRLRQAADCYRRALELVAGAGELEFEAAVHGSLGTAYLNLGESELARDSYLRALDLRRAAGDRGGEARALNNLAVLYRSLGEVQQAVLYYGQALEAFEEQGDLRWQARTLNNLGYAYYSLGELERARALLRQALPLRRRVVDRRGEAATSRNLGLVESGLGHHEVAAAHLRRALELSRARGDRRGTAAALIALGRERRRLGATVAAIDDFVQALIAAEESGDRGQRAEALHQIGDARLELGEASAAVLSLRAALEERRRIRDPAGQAETLTALAAAEERLGRPADALARIEEALEVIESLRAGIADPHLRATFSGVRRRAYELHLALLMKRHAAEPRGGFDRAALESSERARARTLLELLEEAGAGLRRGASPELAERRRRLLERLGLKAQRQLELLSAGASPDEARIAELELFAVLAELERVEAEIRRLNPSYAALTRPPPIAVAEIQQLLDGDDLLLEYALGEEKSFLWAVGRDSLQSFELPGRAAIEAAARRVYGQLSTVDPRGDAAAGDAPQALSRMLLGPVAGELAGRRLVVVADGALHYLPFAALPEPAGGAPLLAGHEVVHLPSAAALAVMRRQLAGRRPAPKWLAVVADPVFDRRDPRLATEEAAQPARGSVDRSGEPPALSFDRLPASRREAERIAALLPPGQVLQLFDFDARRQNLLRPGLGQYRILHFATHGFFDARHPELSGLVLSLVDEHGAAQDGLLRLRDVYELELGADLVVLSGCQTALGREIRGEGLVGLTRGFMYAGVPRVVASLWRVGDRATAELMERFYRGLVAGLRPAAALRAAQLEIRARPRWADPYHWAAFVLQGDWR